MADADVLARFASYLTGTREPPGSLPYTALISIAMHCDAPTLKSMQSVSTPCKRAVQFARSAASS